MAQAAESDYSIKMRKSFATTGIQLTAKGFQRGEVVAISCEAILDQKQHVLAPVLLPNF